MKILFVCKNNQFRSQMASALYNHLTGSSNAFSAGTWVGTPEVPEGAQIEQFFRTKDFFELMEGHGINIRQNKTTKLTPERMNSFDLVVSMAEEPFIPKFLKESSKTIWWEVDNPPFATKEVSEKTFAQISNLISTLLGSSVGCESRNRIESQNSLILQRANC